MILLMSLHVSQLSLQVLERTTRILEDLISGIGPFTIVSASEETDDPVGRSAIATVQKMWRNDLRSAQGEILRHGAVILSFRIRVAPGVSLVDKPAIVLMKVVGVGILCIGHIIKKKNLKATIE